VVPFVMLEHDRYGLALTYAGASLLFDPAGVWIATAITRPTQLLR
jgi:hypothetical protein